MDFTDFWGSRPLLYGTFSQANHTSTIDNRRASSRAIRRLALVLEVCGRTLGS